MVRILSFILLGIALVQTSVCGAPSNDNFADRILLIGNDVTFMGDLTGSTVEPNEPTNLLYDPNPATHSVWWSWTATETGPVTIAALNYSVDTYLNSTAGYTSALAVYAGTNVFGEPPATTTNLLWPEASLSGVSLTFQASAGTNYQIQFFGFHPTLAMTFRLMATNSPVVLADPSPQTVFPGGSALFTVIAAGLGPLSYQWQFQGTNLPGATSPMLALDNITPDQAGAYAVVVSSSTGSTTTAPAALLVTTNALPPSLAPRPSADSNSFSFALVGEVGRYYRIQSSPDLVHWNNEASFWPLTVPLVYPPYVNLKTSVVYAGNSNLVLSVPSQATAKFVRALLYVAPSELCNNNLKQIRYAKDYWRRNGLPQWRNAVPAWSDLLPEVSYLHDPAVSAGSLSGASYVLNDVMTLPICIISQNHVLEEMQ